MPSPMHDKDKLDERAGKFARIRLSEFILLVEQIIARNLDRTERGRLESAAAELCFAYVREVIEEPAGD